MNALTNNQEKQITREEWLNVGLEELKPLFLMAGIEVKGKVHISVGFSGQNVRGSRNGSKTLGVAYNSRVSTSGHTEIFISPEIDDAVEVLAVLTHEIIHHLVPNAGHGCAFRQIAVSVGLEGQMRATRPSAKLREQLEMIVANMPVYPMKKMLLSDRPKQETRLIKCKCELCGMIIYTTRKWLVVNGTPTCGCGSPLPMVEA